MAKQKSIKKTKVAETEVSSTKKAKKIVNKVMGKLQKKNKGKKPVLAENDSSSDDSSSTAEMIQKLPILEDKKVKAIEAEEISHDGVEEHESAPLVMPIDSAAPSKKDKKKKNKKNKKKESKEVQVEEPIPVKEKENSELKESEEESDPEFKIISKPTKNVPQKRNEQDSSNQDSCSRVHIINLSPRTNEQSLRSFFEGKGLNTVDIFVPRNNDRPVRFAFVEFDSIDSAQQAIALSGSSIDNSEVTITQARPRANKQNNERQTSAESSTLFVRGLGEALENEQQLHEMFDGAKDIRVPRGPDGSTRGVAYVEYNTTEEAKEMQNSLKSQNIYCDFAQPRGQSNFGQRNNFGGRPPFRNNNNFNERRGSNFSRGNDRGRGFQRGGYHGGVGKPRYFNNNNNGQSFNKRPQFDGKPRGTKIQFNNDE